MIFGLIYFKNITFETILVFWIFLLTQKHWLFLFYSTKRRHSKSDVSNLCFVCLIYFSLSCNDTNMLKTYLNEVEQITKLDFCICSEHTKRFSLSASRRCDWCLTKETLFLPFQKKRPNFLRRSLSFMFGNSHSSFLNFVHTPELSL